MLKLKDMEEIFKEIYPQKCGDILKIIKREKIFQKIKNIFVNL